jgi:fucose permease
VLVQQGVAFLLVVACLIAATALVFLGFASPPYPPTLRMFGLWTVGFATGLLNGAIVYAISPAYRQNAAATTNMAGLFFGIGCLVAAIIVGGTFYVYSVTGILLLAAIFPTAFLILFRRTNFPEVSFADEPTVEQAILDFRNPAAVLLALLLFLQFGNEWAIAGWLPVYLIHRVGISPESSLWLLALYWLALIGGRVIAISILPRVSHTRLLFGSAASAMFACLILLMTNNWFGAVAGVLLAGGGFATIYPLVAEKIGHRFTYFRPGLYNGIFSFALVGSTLAPASIGYAAAAFGIGVAMALPLVGTILVVIVLLLIWLESKIGG